MVSILESQRSTIVGLDTLESTLTGLLVQPPSKIHRERLALQHRSAVLLDRIVTNSVNLSETYINRKSERQSEIDLIGGGDSRDIPGAIAEFYGRLAKLKDQHRKYPDLAKRPGTEEDVVDFAELEGIGVVDGRDCESHHLHSLIVAQVGHKQSWIECSPERKVWGGIWI